MKKYYLCLLLSIILSSCSYKKNHLDNGISGCQCTVTDKELASYKRKALAGDSHSAYELAEYYAQHKNKKEMADWDIIAVENNLYNPPNKNELRSIAYAIESANDMSQGGYCADIYRAKYWAGLAQKKGDGELKDFLEQMDGKLSYYLYCKRNTPDLQKKALLGSPEAASELVDDYESKNDLAGEIYFIRIAIQNGDKKFIRRLGMLLQKSRDPLDQIRSTYWLGLGKE